MIKIGVKLMVILSSGAQQYVDPNDKAMEFFGIMFFTAIKIQWFNGSFVGQHNSSCSVGKGCVNRNSLHLISFFAILVIQKVVNYCEFTIFSAYIYYWK